MTIRYVIMHTGRHHDQAVDASRLVLLCLMILLPLVSYICIFWLLYYKLIPLYAKLSLILTQQTIDQLQKLTEGIGFLLVKMTPSNMLKMDIIHHVEKQLEHLKIPKQVYDILADICGKDLAGIIMNYTSVSLYDDM